MSDVHFYHDAEDRVVAACHFAVKAWKAGRRVALAAADAAERQRIDHALWTADPLAFIPHVEATSPLAAETPIQLGAPGDPWPHGDVLIHLGPDLPSEADRFAMVVEIVGRSEADRIPARQRWRAYQAAGHRLSAHGLTPRD
ncbi:MAG: DNA polymerase III subunit chi [Zoogloeaceae bacterium]|nr:DNA polymerase III subunit chi [Zoogloeaceae bacterium]